jgi:hypothetical protein
MKPAPIQGRAFFMLDYDVQTEDTKQKTAGRHLYTGDDLPETP